jgi:hypothetical protein
MRQLVHIFHLKCHIFKQLSVEPRKIQFGVDSFMEIKYENTSILLEKFQGNINSLNDSSRKTEYEVEKIVNHRIWKGKIQYLIRWRNYTH